MHVLDFATSDLLSEDFFDKLKCFVIEIVK